MKYLHEVFWCSSKVPGFEGDQLVIDQEGSGRLWLEMRRPRNDQAISISLNAEQARRFAAMLLAFADNKQKEGV